VQPGCDCCDGAAVPPAVRLSALARKAAGLWRISVLAGKAAKLWCI